MLRPMLLAILVLVAGAGRVLATCNVVPSADRAFIGDRGNASQPFAQPGDEIVIRADTTAFAEDPAQNAVVLRFEAAGGTTVPVADVRRPCDDQGCVGDACPCRGSTCRLSECNQSGQCSCIGFAF